MQIQTFFSQFSLYSSIWLTQPLQEVLKGLCKSRETKEHVNLIKIPCALIFTPGGNICEPALSKGWCNFVSHLTAALKLMPLGSVSREGRISFLQQRFLSFECVKWEKNKLLFRLQDVHKDLFLLIEIQTCLCCFFHFSSLSMYTSG